MGATLTRKGLATRQRIVAGAAELFRERGVAGTSLDDVCEATSTSKSQLFHYFPDGRTQLLTAVAQHEADRVLDDQQPALDQLTSWTAWQAWRDQVVERYQAQGQACPLAVLTSQLGPGSHEHREVVGGLLRRWQGKIADGIRTMQAAGEVRPEVDADRHAAALLAGIQGGVVIMLATGGISHLEVALDEGIGALRETSAALGGARNVSGLRSRMRRFLQKPGSASLDRYEELLPDIAGREESLRGLGDAELAAAAAEATDDAGICAVGREAARRALGERPFDVQLLGTLAMLSVQVAEMATGEGKTLSGALAAAGYVRRGHRVQVMSVNDYLARRDAEWMGPVYELLGVSVGWVTQASTPQERRQAYAADVCYGSASEIGFDVLRDRLATSVADLVTGEPDVILIDEADSVLVDEALVPLVLAGSAGAADSGREMAAIAGRLLPRLHYEVDDERRNVFLTDAGARIAEQALDGINLYAEQNLDVLTQLNVALHARALLQRDVDYIVRDDRIHLISASRGRVARRQRWPDGLHAAVEAKEGLRASESGQILDSITIQALVQRYPVACGMTGTAVAVGEQLREFYGLEIAVIPPNLPCVREDEPDRLYRTAADKEDAVVTQVAETHVTGRPVLIGTLDVAESERLATRMGQAGLSCVVLNAKNDAQEAAIVAEAGALGAITVSTQMAGRGTDIRLGGSQGGSAKRRPGRGGRAGRAPGDRHGPARHAAGSMTSCAAGRGARATRVAPCSWSAWRTS